MVPLFADDMILYIRDPQKSHQQTPTLSVKCKDPKINLQKSVIFCTPTTTTKREEITHTFSFTIASKCI